MDRLRRYWRGLHLGLGCWRRAARLGVASDKPQTPKVDKGSRIPIFFRSRQIPAAPRRHAFRAHSDRVPHRSVIVATQTRRLGKALLRA